MGEPQNGWFIVEKNIFHMDEMGFFVTTMTSESSERIHGSPQDRDVGMLLPGQ